MQQILHIINGEFYSGAERVQDLLALRLPDSGYELLFACIKPRIFPTCCQANKDRVHPFAMNSKFDLRQSFLISAFAKKHNCLLIHTHTPRTALIGALASILSGLPQVHHVHSPTASCTDNHWRNRINPFAERLAVMRSKKIIAVSDSIKQYLVSEKIAGQRIIVVPNGVPTPGPLPKRLSPQGRWTIGTVALFRPRKGIEILLEALALLKRRHVSFLFRAVGGFESAEYEHATKKRASDLGLTNEIDWCGFRHEINEELRSMDIFVLPSLAGEGTPMVILEAMAVGVPVVATQVEGIPEVIRNNEEGLLAPAGDTKRLTTALLKVITGEVEWQDIRKKAYQRQSLYYSDRRMATQVAKIYDRILAPETLTTEEIEGV